jgi:hypothetical protein
MSETEPALWAKIKTELARCLIDRKRDLYVVTGNPVHAWAAYQIARRADVPAPSWVLDYLDDCAEALTGPDSPRSKTAIADALRLGKKGGRSLTAQAAMEERNLSLVDQIQVLRQRDPNRIAEVAEQLGDADRAKELRQERLRSVDDVIAEVADRHGLSFDRVREIYYSFPAHLR